jgi:PAS domain S-box-containing protein
MTIDATGRISHSNAAADDLFGYDSSTMEMKVSDLIEVPSVEVLNSYIHPPKIDAHIQLMMGKTSTGEQVPIAIHLTAWTDEDGLQHAMILRNLTEFMKAEKATSIELKRANTAINAAQIGVFEYFPIEDRAVVSGMWRKIMELDWDDPVDAQQEWRSRVHPDDLPIALEAVQLCVDGEQEKATSEYRLLSKDGTKWRWMQVNVAGITKNTAGQVTSVVGSMSDISQRKEFELSLRDSNEQFRSAFENSPIGHVVFGLDASWWRVNKALCDALGYSKKVLVTKSASELTHPESMQRSSEQFVKLSKGEIDHYIEDRRYIRSDGSAMYAKVTVSLVRDASGRPNHILCQVMDLTEQRRLNAMKGEFVATISHELRTPLTSVLGSIRLLMAIKSENLPEKAPRLLEIAQQNGDRLYNLINDILDFEKFSVNQMDLSLGNHDVIAQMKDAMQANMHIADSFDVQYKLVTGIEDAYGNIDPRRFQQVMNNLLTNAAKFAHPNTEIAVRVDDLGSYHKVSVTNHGEGVPHAFRDQIFSPFSQAKEVDTRSRGGTGLGLVISKQIVQLSGGKIGFDSIVGEKTTFWFTIPKELLHSKNLVDETANIRQTIIKKERFTF